MATFRKRKDKWQVQVRLKGLPAISRSFVLLNDAKAWARDVEAEATRSDLPSFQKQKMKCSVRELLKRYDLEIARYKKCYPSEKYTIAYLARCAFTLNSLDEISEADFAKYKKQRLNQVKPATFNREIAILRHMFQIAETEWKYPIKKNPLKDFKKPKVQNERQRRLSHGEYVKLRQASLKTINPYIWTIVELALETAMRRGEIIGICKSHIDFDKRLLQIPLTKTGCARTIPLSQKAFSILESVANVSVADKLFPITANSFRLAWEKLVKRAGITDLHFHDLRHEAVSRLFEKGLSVPEVALISGHKTYKMLMRYTHIRPESVLNKL